ncbi:MAG: 3-deoxy-7-phosphoheptulonate synthase [Ruminococcaceae bacterium]|nr:3-deoxy-7-phosphoheptulonate synthase [Oscillospiraceae bacterium]
MIIILKENVKKANIDEVCSIASSMGITANPIVGSHTTVVGLVGDTSAVDSSRFELLPYVEKVMKVQEPFKRANRKFHPKDTVININGQKIGGKKIQIIAGPCSVETEEQITLIAQSVKNSGAEFLRGGAFKPRTSPYSFQGLKAEGLVYLEEAKKATDLPIVSEITNPFHIEMFNEYVDIIQVGARNMQNFELLKELGKLKKPILLKRGFSNTIEEFLMSAEYIMSNGNTNVILCERGIRTFETATRNTLDISAVPLLKKLSHLPVFVDPSHAAGINWLVEPLAKSAIAAGADGIIIEVHNDPKHALSDGNQSITPEEFEALVPKLKKVARAIGREI